MILNIRDDDSILVNPSSTKRRTSSWSQHYKIHLHTHTHSPRDKKLGRKLVMHHLIVQFLVHSIVTHIGFSIIKYVKC